MQFLHNNPNSNILLQRIIVLLDLLCNEFILGADIFTLIEVQEVLLAKDAIFKILREGLTQAKRNELGLIYFLPNSLEIGILLNKNEH